MIENIYNPEYVKDLFNRMSSSYERMNYLTSFGFSIRWRKQFLKPFQSTDSKIEIIDLLTGMGETWGGVKSKFPNAQLTALDFSSEMLKHAKHKNKHYYNNEVILLQQNILQNELPANHYDVVICAFGLKTFNNEQLQTIAAETMRILKPGGQFSFIEISKPANKLLNLLFNFYLDKMIPIIGRLLLGNPTQYKMLWHYTNKFGNAKSAAGIFNSQGLSTKYQSYFYDCATGFSGCKKPVSVRSS